MAGSMAQPIVDSSQTRSFASVAVHAQHTNISASQVRFFPPRADNFFCTVDLSRVEGGDHTKDLASLRKNVEIEIRKGDDKSFLCRAITRDRRQLDRIRILCRGEEELKTVKQAAESTVPTGARMLRDQLYPVKVNNARTNAVIKPDGLLINDALLSLNENNNTDIAKIAWLSSRQSGKAYGSMAVFFKTSSEAARFLKEAFMYVGGESATVRVFEPDMGPPRCFKCQERGHKAYSCKGNVRCGRCAEEGHFFYQCNSLVEKCASCSGPHSVNSRTCSFHGR